MAALVVATVNDSSNGGAGGGDSGCVAVMTTAAAVPASDAESNDANGASANGREARNLAEKQRRDKLNASIQELATMVPHAAESTRRLDKTAVLRFATHGLRLQYVFGKSAIRRRRKLNLKVPNGSSNASNHGVGGGGGAAEYTGNSLINGDTPQLTDKLMQLLDSFFLTLTCNGQIVLVSGSVEQLLGHCQSDLYGQNLLQITHPDDQALLRQQLIPRDIETLFYQQQQQQHQQHRRQQQQRRRKQSHSQSHSTSASDDEEGMEQLEDQEREQHDQLQMRDEEHDEEDDEETRRTRTPSPETIAHLAAIDERLRADRRCFTVRLARASTRAEATRHYEVVKIDGCFRRSDSSVTGGAAANYPIVSQLIRRSRNNNMLAAAAAAAATASAAVSSSSSSASSLPPPCLPQHDAIAQAALHGISGNDIVLVAMARVMRENSSTPNLSLLCRQPEPYQLEYRTRHLIDGSIIDCDQRIGIVAGYMKDEVRNLSPFSFMHLDDVRWVIVALRQMYDSNNDYGESCYRLLSRNGHFIYLQSKGFLEIDKSSNKVHSFLCVNTLLDEQAGKRKVQEMKNKFSTIIKADIPTDTSPDLPASRAPQQLERIVLYLIENLQKSADGAATTEHGGHEATATHNGGDVTMMDAIDDAGCCSSPGSSNATLTEEQAASPSMAQPQVLALVPPAPGHVKHSISKSVDVVNVTSARNLQYQQQKQQQQKQQQQKQQQLQQQLLQQQQHSPASSVIRQLSCCLSESSTLSPGSASSLELPDEANNSDGSTPPPALLSISAAAPRVSVLQRLMTTPTKPTATAVAATPATPPPTQLQAALSNTLRSLDTQLVTIAEEAQMLYQQQQKQREALLPKFERQMDAIMLEHQMQKQLLVNITSEYNATTTTTATAAPVSVITKLATTSSENGNNRSSSNI